LGLFSQKKYLQTKSPAPPLSIGPWGAPPIFFQTMVAFKKKKSFPPGEKFSIRNGVQDFFFFSPCFRRPSNKFFPRGNSPGKLGFRPGLFFFFFFAFMTTSGGKQWAKKSHGFRVCAPPLFGIQRNAPLFGGNPPANRESPSISPGRCFSPKSRRLFPPFG